MQIRLQELKIRVMLWLAPEFLVETTMYSTLGLGINRPK